MADTQNTQKAPEAAPKADKDAKLKMSNPGAVTPATPKAPRKVKLGNGLVAVHN